MNSPSVRVFVNASPPKDGFRGVRWVDEIRCLERSSPEAWRLLALAGDPHGSLITQTFLLVCAIAHRRTDHLCVRFYLKFVRFFRKMSDIGAQTLQPRG
jgi:hypothetical protein